MSDVRVREASLEFGQRSLAKVSFERLRIGSVPVLPVAPPPALQPDDARIARRLPVARGFSARHAGSGPFRGTKPAAEGFARLRADPPVLGLLLSLAAQTPTDFGGNQRQALKDLLPGRQQINALVLKGDVEGAEKVFLDAVPEEKRTAAHCLMTADSFLLFDPDFSRRLHQRAFELAPDEPQVALAWAGELYRAGRFEEALPIYVRSAQTLWDTGIQRIDCLVRTGRIAEALEAWRSVRGAPALSKYFQILPERLEPAGTREQRRIRLRQALARGADEGAEELAFLDLLHRTGQRRFEVDRMDLQADRKLISEHVPPESRRARELWAVCDFWLALWERGFPPASSGDFTSKYGPPLRELGWLEPGGDVPAHPLVARWATSALLESGLRQPAELLSDWERALASRLEEGEGDAGRALLEIQRATGSAQTAETQARLWSQAHDLDAAVELLEQRQEHLESSDPLLHAALERYPESAPLCALASSCARRENKGEREALVRQIKACFQPPGDAEGAQRSFERLEQLQLSGERR